MRGILSSALPQVNKPRPELRCSLETTKTPKYEHLYGKLRKMQVPDDAFHGRWLPMRYTLQMFFLALLALAPSMARADDFDRIALAARRTGAVDLRELFPGEWDTICIVKPYDVESWPQLDAKHIERSTSERDFRVVTINGASRHTVSGGGWGFFQKDEDRLRGERLALIEGLKTSSPCLARENAQVPINGR